MNSKAPTSSLSKCGGVLKVVCSYGSKAIRVMLAGLAVLLLCVPVFAQVEQGRMYGAVTDQSGGAVVGATVTVLDVARGVSRPLTTDTAGEYNAPNLLPGAYTIRAQAKGFQTAERQSIQLQVGGDLRMDFTLQPGEQTTTVTVTEASAPIDTTNATLGGTLTSAEVLDLPVNGRNPQNLEGLLPGVTTKNGGGPTARSTNGLPSKSTVYLLDGQLNKGVYGSTAIIGGSGDIGEGTSLVNLDAVQDFTLQENPKAEVGWAEGVVMNIGIKSGTNALHGSAFAFGRTGALDAANPFSPGVPENLQFEQFGGVIGGHVIKDKLFYFGSYEGERLTEGLSAVNQIPTTASLGDPSLSISDAIANMNLQGFAPNTMSLLMAGCDPTNGAIHSSVGATVATACNASKGLFGNSSKSTQIPQTEPNTFQTDNYIYRADYHINDKHAFMAEYLSGANNLFESTGVNVQRYWDRLNPRRPQIVQMAETWTPTSSIVNQIRYAWDMYLTNVNIGECQLNLGQPNYPVAFGLNSGSQLSACGPNHYGALPAIEFNNGEFTGLGCNGTSMGADCDQEPRDEHTSQIDDYLSYTHGNHLFKFGGEFRHQSSEGWLKPSIAGYVDFGGSSISGVGFAGEAFPGATTLQDFLAGAATDATALVGFPSRFVSANEFALFAQDDWRVTRKLTLNLGLRYEYANPPKEKNYLLASFDPASPAGIYQPGVTPGEPNSLWVPDKTNFQPRLGFAYDITGKGNWVVRGGFGVMTAFVAWNGFFGSGPGGIQGIPTGGLLFNGDGSLRADPGNIKTQVATLVGSSFSGAISPANAVIPWVCNSTASSAACAGNPATPIFNASPSNPNAAVQCGDGQVVNPANGTIPQPCPGDAVQRNLKQGLVYQWNFNVDHSFTNSLTLDLAYVGNKTQGLWMGIDANQPAAGSKANEQMRRPYTENCSPAASGGPNSAPGGLGLAPKECFPYLGEIFQIAADGKSTDEGFQASLVQRLSHGISFTAGYTYSNCKAVQLGDIGALPMNSLNPNQDYGTCEFNLPARFTLAGTWRVPGLKSPGQMLEGWEVSSVLNLQGGLPFNVKDGSNDESGTGIKNDRWTMLGSPSAFNAFTGGVGTVPCYGVAGSKFASKGCKVIPVGIGNPGDPTYVSNMPAVCQQAAAQEVPGINTGLAQLAAIGCYALPNAAMVPPAQGTYGTMGPWALTGKGLYEWDATIAKMWKVKERYTAQFRFEMYNVLNNTFYALPSANLGNPRTFGQSQAAGNNGNPINGAGGPRSIQLGLKLTF